MELLDMKLSAPKEKVDVSVLCFKVKSTLERLKRKSDPRAREVNLAQNSTVHTMLQLSSSPGPRCCISSRHLSPFSACSITPEAQHVQVHRLVHS